MHSKHFAPVAFGALLGLAVAAPALAQTALDHGSRGHGFPDFGHMVTPQEYEANYADQPIFRLKTDFPTGGAGYDVPEFMQDIDFRTDPEAYLIAARDFSFEGNLSDFGGGKIDWDPFANPVREWYHIPWLHPSQAYPPNGGTEGFRGLIKEAEVMPYQLAGSQSGNYQVYAITLINEPAGHTMARMWADPDLPDPGATDKRFGGGFPVGTIFAKFLFTDAPAKPGDDPTNPYDFVEYLQNGVEWKAYITEQWDADTFAVKTVRLLQMDIMTRDARADRSADNPEGTGWVFGTFVYNGAVDNPDSKFLNLVPLGVMWGNDPENRENRVTPYPPRPVADSINPDLEEQVIFDTPVTPPQHLGWNGRLNGPADLNTSSCMSCHITAQYPPLTSLVAPSMVPAGGPLPPALGGTDEWMQWFQNIDAATPFDDRAYSTDMSWQISISLQNFFDNEARLAQGQWTSDFLLDAQPIARGGNY